MRFILQEFLNNSMRAKPVNEKFTEQGDPIADMGIGFAGIHTREQLKHAYPNAKLMQSKIFVEYWDLTGENKLFCRVHFKNENSFSFDIDIVYKMVKEGKRKYDENKYEIIWEKDEEAFERATSTIDEKFAEKSDPIEDMGIGSFPSIIKGLHKLESMPGVGSVNLKNTAGTIYLEIWHYYQNDDKREIIDYVHRCLGEEYFERIGIEQGRSFSRVICRAIIKPEYVKLFTRAFDKDGYVKGINEKFEEKSDPIEDMGVGIKAKYDEWLKNANKEIPYWNLNTPNSQLMLVAASGKTEFVPYLIHTLHADPNFDNAGSLRNAAHKEYYDTAVELIKNGADADLAIKHCNKWNHNDTRLRINKALDLLTKT